MLKKYKMNGKETYLNLEKRRLLYQHILKNPGVHLRKIFRNSKMSEGTIKYHLKYLKKRRLIVEKKIDGYKRYYVKDKVGEEHKKLWSIFRQKTTREILLFFLIYMASSRIKLSKELEKNPKVIEYHLKKLLENDLIEVARVENGIVYLNNDNPRFKEFKAATNEIVYILKNQQKVEDFIITYKKSFFKDSLPLTCISWIDTLRNDVFPDKTRDHDEKLDEFIDEFFDLFPIPICA